MDSARLANRLVCVVDFLHPHFCLFDEGGGQTFCRDLIRMKYPSPPPKSTMPMTIRMME